MGKSPSQSYETSAAYNRLIQCYLSPDASERVRFNPSQASWYSSYLPRKDGRL